MRKPLSPAVLSLLKRGATLLAPIPCLTAEQTDALIATLLAHRATLDAPRPAKGTTGLWLDQAAHVALVELHQRLVEVDGTAYS
jgi:hypothetical protein